MTINEIAQLAGVSRGTVDRVLHNRGKVKPEIQERITAILQQTAFSPNFAASALKRSAKTLRIGVLLPPLSNAFYQDVLSGLEHAAERYAPYGAQVEIVRLEALTEQAQLGAVEALRADGLDGLALSAVDTPSMARTIDALCQQIPVITFNTDFTKSKRLCFVGQEHYAAGRTAGNLLCKSLRRPGKIVPVISNRTLLAHTRRVDGLCSVLSACPVAVTVTPPLETQESDELAYRVVSKALQTESDIACFYVAGGGQVGAANALADSGRSREIMMLCYDLLPATIEHLKSGVVDFTIGQQPFLQGYMPISILYEYLVLGQRPQSSHYYTSIDVRLAGNADFNGISALTGVL